MVTLNEILGDLFRYFITFISGLYALLLAFFLILRLVIGNRLWIISAISNFTPYCFMPLLLLIALALISRAKWGLIVTLPVLGIGVLMFAGLFIPKNPAPTSNPTLHVVTFNVYRSNTNLSRIVAWISHTDADVVLLQELPRRHLVPLTYQMGQTYPYISTQTARGEELSSVILSRFPIVLQQNIVDLDAQDSHFQQRYVIDHDGKLIAIYNIDLAIPSGKPRISFLLFGQWFSQLVLGYDDQARDTEIRNLLNHLEDEPLPYIAAGNFAMSDQTQIYHDVAAVMGDSFRETSTGFGGSWPVQEAVGILPDFVPPLFRIDYIWHSSEFRAVACKQGGYLGSDHLPLEAELEMLPSA